MMNLELALYGNQAAASTATADAQAPEEQTLAERMYRIEGVAAVARNDVPPEVDAARKANIERRMYGASAYEFALPTGSMQGYDVEECRQVAADLDATPEDVLTFRHLAEQHIEEAPSDAVHDDWQAASLKLIQEQAISVQDLEAAKRLVSRDPRLAQFLDDTRLGSHPTVVERLIQLARSARGAGRL